MTGMQSPPIKILAAASSGGHWEQLLVLRDVLELHEVVYATTKADLIERAELDRAYVISDCNRDTPFALIKCFAQAFRIVLKERPHCVISTGALPGFACLLFGRLIGAKAIWLDSVANTEKLSMCGAAARHVATLWLTQWEHLSSEDGPRYAGSVL